MARERYVWAFDHFLDGNFWLNDFPFLTVLLQYPGRYLVPKHFYRYTKDVEEFCWGLSVSSPGAFKERVDNPERLECICLLEAVF